MFANSLQVICALNRFQKGQHRLQLISAWIAGDDPQYSTSFWTSQVHFSGYALRYICHYIDMCRLHKQVFGCTLRSIHGFLSWRSHLSIELPSFLWRVELFGERMSWIKPSNLHHLLSARQPMLSLIYVSCWDPYAKVDHILELPILCNLASFLIHCCLI